VRALLRTAWIACVALLVLGAARVSAHEISMAEMELRQLQAGEFLWQWTAGQRGDALLRPLWPEGCRDESGTLRCGEDGLRGWLGMQGMGNRYSAVLVKIHWRGDQTRVYTLTAGQPSVQLFGAADDPRGVSEIASAYTVLGVEHILTGFDHLMFVLALLFLVGFNRRLVWTITAFTLAHSVTLALSVLGWIVLRQPPVEATIALSIMLVASEALHQRGTVSRRWPALVAFLFGLVHGLGFAGALTQFGLPQQHLAAALLTFNLGVELGQMLAVATAFAVARLLSRWSAAYRARTPALYVMGGVAAYWSWGRVVAMLA
jgi:hypothetical protein